MPLKFRDFLCLETFDFRQGPARGEAPLAGLVFPDHMIAIDDRLSHMGNTPLTCSVMARPLRPIRLPIKGGAAGIR